MTGEPSPLYRATRRALLDALDALTGQHDAVILVGAQAVFLRAGDVDEAIATETKDADLAVNPELLAAAPLIEEAMRAAGFDLDARHPQPGTWISSGGTPVDLLIPDAVSGRTGRGRSGRIKPHSNMSTRRVRGIEGALVDHAPMTIAALDVDDDREHQLNVAGPMALLVAKLHKVADREAEGARQRPRDAHDVYRLLREVDLDVFVAGYARLDAADVSRPVTQEAVTALERLFSTPERPGAAQVAEAVDGLVEEPQDLAVRCAILTGQLLRAIG